MKPISKRSKAVIGEVWKELWEWHSHWWRDQWIKTPYVCCLTSCFVGSDLFLGKFLICMFGPNPIRVVFEFKHNIVIVAHPIFMFGKPKFLWHCWDSTGVQLFFKCFNHTEGMIGHSTTNPCIRSGSSVWYLSGWSEASVPPIVSHVGKRSKTGNFTKEKCERNNQFIVSGCYIVEIQNWMDVCFCTAIIGQHTLPLVGWDLNNSGLSTRILKMDKIWDKMRFIPLYSSSRWGWISHWRIKHKHYFFYHSLLCNLNRLHHEYPDGPWLAEQHMKIASALGSQINSDGWHMYISVKIGVAQNLIFLDFSALQTDKNIWGFGSVNMTQGP